MDSLFLIDQSAEHLDVKEELLKEFNNRFRNAKLTRTEANGSQKVIVPANDPLNFNGYRISRKDLIRFLIELSKPVGNNNDLPELRNTLNNLLDDADANKNHPLNNEGRALWLDWGYGLSNPRVIDNAVKASGKELQIVLTGVTDGEHPEDRERGVVCATTARVKKGGNPTDPPLSGTVNPKN